MQTQRSTGVMLDARSRVTARWFLVKLVMFCVLAGATALAVPQRHAVDMALRSLGVSCGIGAAFCGLLFFARGARLPGWLDSGDEALAFMALASLFRIVSRLT